MRKIFGKILAHKQNLFAVTAGQVVAASGTLVGMRLLTGYISPSVYGEYKLLLAAISLVTSIFFRPFIQFAMREYHDVQKRGVLPQFITNVRIIFCSYVLLIAMLTGIAISFVHSRLIDITPFLLLTTLAVLVSRSGVELERAFMVTENLQIQASMVSVARNWLVPIAIAGMAVFINKSVAIMFLATLVVLTFVYLSQRYASHDTCLQRLGNSEKIDKVRLIRSAINYGIPLAGVGLLSWLVHESDRFFLSYYQSDEVVGIYSAAYGLVSAPFTLVVGSMAQFLYPIMFRVSSSRDQKRKTSVLKAMLTASGVICLLGVGFIGLFSKQIAWLALGERYRQEATGLMFWVALGYAFLAISMSFDLAAYGEKRTSDMFIAYGLAAITNVSLNIILIPDNGAMGAVSATVVSLFLYLVVMSTLYFHRNQTAFSGRTTS